VKFSATACKILVNHMLNHPSGMNENLKGNAEHSTTRPQHDNKGKLMNKCIFKASVG
jgi:hypothetical protein